MMFLLAVVAPNFINTIANPNNSIVFTLYNEPLSILIKSLADFKVIKLSILLR